MNPLRIVTYHPHAHSIVVLGRTIHLRRRGGSDDTEISAPISQAEADHLQGGMPPHYQVQGDAEAPDVATTPATTPPPDAAADTAPPTPVETPLAPPRQPTVIETAPPGADTHAGGLTPDQPPQEA